MSLTTGKSNAFTTVWELTKTILKEEGATAAGLEPDEASVDFASIEIEVNR